MIFVLKVVKTSVCIYLDDSSESTRADAAEAVDAEETTTANDAATLWVEVASSTTSSMNFCASEASAGTVRTKKLQAAVRISLLQRKQEQLSLMHSIWKMFFFRKN